MHRFMMEPGAGTGELVALNGEESRHALRVLRLSPGDAVEVSDGCGKLFGAVIESVMGGEVSVRLQGEIASKEAPVSLTLYQGLPKFDKLELICQKATELGAARIVPVKTSRAVVKVSAADGEKRRERMQKICAEAAKQCGRAAVPEVLAPVEFGEALRMMGEEQLMLMPWELEAGGRRLGDIHKERGAAARVGIFIGPEGGIDEKEAARAQGTGAIAVGLGPRILRTETAAIASMALVMQLWGDI